MPGKPIRTEVRSRTLKSVVDNCHPYYLTKVEGRVHVNPNTVVVVIDVIENDREAFAAVLSHELGHVALDHFGIQLFPKELEAWLWGLRHLRQQPLWDELDKYKVFCFASECLFTYRSTREEKVRAYESLAQSIVG